MICLNQGILSWEWHDWVPSAGVTVKVYNIFLTAFAIEMNIKPTINVHLFKVVSQQISIWDYWSLVYESMTWFF